jgi:hypothetical protein
MGNQTDPCQTHHSTDYVQSFPRFSRKQDPENSSKDGCGELECDSVGQGQILNAKEPGTMRIEGQCEKNTSIMMQQSYHMHSHDGSGPKSTSHQQPHAIAIAFKSQWILAIINYGSQTQHYLHQTSIKDQDKRVGRPLHELYE